MCSNQELAQKIDKLNGRLNEVEGLSDQLKASYRGMDKRLIDIKHQQMSADNNINAMAESMENSFERIEKHFQSMKAEYPDGFLKWQKELWDSGVRMKKLLKPLIAVLIGLMTTWILVVEWWEHTKWWR